MYDHVSKHAKGFEPRGTVRSFNNKYYEKAAVVDQPSIDAPYDVDEYSFIAERTDKRVKIPFTGPYTMVDWSYDEHYHRTGALGATAEQRADARRRFLLDVAEHVIRPNAAAVVEAGCDWIQIDEPALTTRPDEVKFGVEAFNKSVEGIPSQRRSLHVCFSDYSLLYPHVLELDDCFELQLEFAQRDSRETGTSREERPGYEPLDHFKEHGGPDVGLGVLDIHSDFIETPELVRDRVIYAAELLGPERVHVNPDCGLRTRSWDVAFEKLRNMVEGTRLAEEALNQAHAGARLNQAELAAWSGTIRRCERQLSVRVFRMRTTLKRGIGRGAAVNGNGRAVLPPGVLTPVTHYRQPDPTRSIWGSLARIFLLTVAIGSIAVFGAAGGVYLEALAAVEDLAPKEQVKLALDQLDIAPANAPANALVIGYDHRPEDGTAPSRSDTVMLLRADPQGDTISMLSFPRDLIVDVRCPNGGRSLARINAAYSFCEVEGPSTP